jgi:hypothetical protein
MNSFLHKTALFFLLPFCVLLIFLCTLNYINNKALANYRVDKNITSLFIGDSHMQLAVNDSLLSNGINLSQTSESLLYSYFKAKAIIENNPAIKKLYLGVSYHSISDYYDEYIYGQYSADISPRYFFILPAKEKIKIIVGNIIRLPDFIKNIISNGCNTITAKPHLYSFMGHYENGFDTSVISKSSMDKRLQLQFYNNDKVRGFSSVDIYYLGKIIDLCKANNVQLTILNTPLYPYYKNKIPKKFIDEYNTLLTKNHLRLLDFHELNLSDSSFIPDGDHVSVKGAKLVTKFLNSDSNKQ